MTWIWAAVLAVAVVVATVYALCAAASIGDAPLNAAVHRRPKPAAPVRDAVTRLAPGLERLIALSAEMLEADLAAVVLDTGVWSWRPGERRVRRRVAGTDPASLLDHPRAAATAPIGRPEEAAGRLTVISTRRDRRFSSRELALLGTLADACGAALEGRAAAGVAAVAAQVELLAATLGPGRDELRWRGADFVALTAAVGRRMRLEEAEQAELELAARLLDVGLLRIPADVLRRAGPLSSAERRLMRRHPSWGADALLRVPDLGAVALLVLAHHERWDGSGYPHGLAGERIPLGARVLAGCDAWWAMSSDRPYAPALAPEEAVDELVAAAGTQLDRRVVEALLAEVAGATLVA